MRRIAIIFIHHFQTDENAANAGIADEMGFPLLLLSPLPPPLLFFNMSIRIDEPKRKDGSMCSSFAAPLFWWTWLVDHQVDPPGSAICDRKDATTIINRDGGIFAPTVGRRSADLQCRGGGGGGVATPSVIGKWNCLSIFQSSRRNWIQLLNRCRPLQGAVKDNWGETSGEEWGEGQGEGLGGGDGGGPVAPGALWTNEPIRLKAS